MLDFTNSLKAAAIAVGLVAVPMTADALTIRLTDNVNGSSVLTLNDGDNDGVVNFTGGYGGFALTLASGVVQGFPPIDTLFGNLTAALLDGVGSADITLEVSHWFDNTGTIPGTAPLELTQDLNVLTGAGGVETFYNAGNNLFGTDTSLNDIMSTGASASAHIVTPVDLNSYTITHVINLSTTSASGAVQGSATTVAPVPVPAAGFLLIAALGGLGLMSRRKAAA